MRIAIDIDSTLHQYWDQLRAAVKARHGIDLPYEDQHTWHIPQLEPELLAECVAQTHCDEQVLGAEPYPDAVDVVRRWHKAGHFIHITSHRSTDARDTTARWLEKIGLPYHDLHCSYDKISRCVELGIDLLIDDSPVNMKRAADAGIIPATLSHPWNREICAERGFICANSWLELEREIAGLSLPVRPA